MHDKDSRRTIGGGTMPPHAAATRPSSDADDDASSGTVAATATPPAFRRGLRRKESALRLYQPRCVEGVAKFILKNKLSTVHIELDSLQGIKAFLQELCSDSLSLEAMTIVSDAPDGDPALVPLLARCLQTNSSLISVKLQFRSNPKIVEAGIPHFPRSVKYADFTGSYIPSVTPELIHELRRFIIRAEPWEVNLHGCGLTPQDGHALLNCLEGLGPFLTLHQVYGLPLKGLGEVALPFCKTNADVMNYLKARAFSKCLVSKKVRVWWSPTSDPGRSDFAGRFWPTKILQVNPSTMSFLVVYDNQDQGYVNFQDVFPCNPYAWGGGLTEPQALSSPDSQRIRSNVSRCFRSQGWKIKRQPALPQPALPQPSGPARGHSEGTQRVTRKRPRGSGAPGKAVKEEQEKEEAQKRCKRAAMGSNGDTVVNRSASNRRKGGAVGSSPPSGSGSRRPSLNAQNITRMMSEDGTRQLPSQVLMDFDSVMAQKKGQHAKLFAAIQARVAQLSASRSFDLAEFEFFILQVPANRLGQVLFPGEICEMRDATVAVTPDPSEYIVIVDSVYPVEPYYGVRYIFHDENDAVRVRSGDVRRALATPWDSWRDSTLAALRRCRDVQEKFHVEEQDAAGLCEQWSKDHVVERSILQPPCTAFYRPRTSAAALNAATVNKIAVVSPRQLPTVADEDFALWFLLQAAEFGHPLLSAERPAAAAHASTSSDEELKAQVRALEAFRQEALELREKFSVFSQRVGEIKKIVTCCICLTRPLALLTIPCGHLVSCEECGQKVDSCPMCREKIKKRIAVTNFSTDVYDTLKDFIAVDID